MTHTRINYHDVKAAIDLDRKADNPNRWTAIDELVAAAAGVRNPYECYGWDEEWRDRLNGGEIADVLSALAEVKRAFSRKRLYV